jgi:hypothetical protein
VKRALGSTRCSLEVEAAEAGGVDRLQRDRELARRQRPLHLLLAEDEVVAEDAAATEVGALGAEVEAAVGAAQPRVDRDRGRRERLVVDHQLDGLTPGQDGELGGRVFEDAHFGFLGFPVFCGDFGAELHVFFVFDRAAVFTAFSFVFAVDFALVGFFISGFGWAADDIGQGQRRRRSGNGKQREESEDQEKGQPAHRPLSSEGRR